MSYIESGIKAIENAAPKNEVLSRMEQRADLVGNYLDGSISLNELGEKLRNLDDLQEKHVVVLPFVGPLYGFLRRMNVSPEYAYKLSYEERQHYLMLRSLTPNAESKVIIRFSVDEKGHHIHASLWIPVPQSEADDNDHKFLFTEVLLAPDDPSDLDNRSLKAGNS